MVVEVGPVDAREFFVGERRVQVQAEHLGAERRIEAADRDRCVRQNGLGEGRHDDTLAVVTWAILGMPNCQANESKRATIDALRIRPKRFIDMCFLPTARAFPR